jgi:predicted ester cyclase
MSIEQNKAIVRRFIDGYNGRRLEVFEELVAEDYVDHTHGQRGRENLQVLFVKAFEAFPDWHEAIEDIVAEGDRVWLRIRATGTHTGDWDLFGARFPATGQRIGMDMVFIWRIVDGRIAEGWEVDDNLEFLRGLGAVAYTEAGRPLEEVFA